MEKENNTNIEKETIKIEEPKNNKKLSTPQAIILSAFLIVLTIVVTNNGNIKPSNKDLTPSEKVGVSKSDLDACINNADVKQLATDIMKSVDGAMSALPNEKRGTPYSIVIGTNGLKSEIQGAQSYDEVKKTVDGILASQPVNEYKGNVVLSEPTDHTKGNTNATVTIIEYSDFECPYCKRFHPTMEQIVKDYKGQVKWVYRQFPLHQNSMIKLLAADCVGKIKGDDEYFQYSNLLFGLLKTNEETITDQL